MKPIPILFTAIIIIISACHKREKIDTDTIEQVVPVYRTITHKFIKLEERAGFKVDKNSVYVLDKLIHESEILIKERNIDLKEDPITVLSTIHEVLDNNGFEYRKNSLLLSDGLLTGKIDCDNYCLLYLGIGEILELPLKAVNAPNHLYIKWDTLISWEATEGFVFDEGFFMRQLDSNLVRNRIYLKELTDNELLAFQYENIGLRFFNDGNLFEAIDYYDKAISLAPENPSFFNNKGNALAVLGILHEALDNYLEAVRLDHTQSAFFSNIGNIYMNLNIHGKAVESYEKALKLADDNPDIYNNMGVVLYQSNRLNEALSKFDRAIELNPYVADYYFNKAVTYYLMRNLYKAKKIYQMGKNLEKVP